MIRRPPRSTLSSSSAASDVYKRQEYTMKPQKFMNPYLAGFLLGLVLLGTIYVTGRGLGASGAVKSVVLSSVMKVAPQHSANTSVSYTHLRAHETRHDL